MTARVPPLLWQSLFCTRHSSSSRRSWIPFELGTKSNKPVCLCLLFALHLPLFLGAHTCLFCLLQSPCLKNCLSCCLHSLRCERLLVYAILFVGGMIVYGVLFLCDFMWRAARLSWKSVSLKEKSTVFSNLALNPLPVCYHNDTNDYCYLYPSQAVNQTNYCLPHAFRSKIHHQQ